MRIIAVQILVALVGCAKSTSENSIDVSLPNNITPPSAQSKTLSVIAVPRPNSGTFSTERATELLPSFLDRSASISAANEIVTEWNSPTQGIRVNVHADQTIEVYDFFGSKSSGLDAIHRALDTTMTMGNERSVLLTSDESGWNTPLKQRVVSLLFQPSVQIYIVAGR